MNLFQLFYCLLFFLLFYLSPLMISIKIYDKNKIEVFNKTFHENIKTNDMK